MRCGAACHGVAHPASNALEAIGKGDALGCRYCSYPAHYTLPRHLIVQNQTGSDNAQVSCTGLHILTPGGPICTH